MPRTKGKEGVATASTARSLGAREPKSPWLQAEQDSEFPRDFPCPHCGRLLGDPNVEEIPDPKTLHLIETCRKTGRVVENDRVVFTLVAEYQCDTCDGEMRGLGTRVATSWQYYPNEVYATSTEEFRILWLHPSPQPMTVPPGCPEGVRKAICEAFELIWHPSICASRIRLVIELIADHFRVPRYEFSNVKAPKPGAPKRRKRRLSLHQRIDKLADKTKVRRAQADLLKAVKWLGNEGTHGEISMTDLFELIGIFGLAINRIFGTDEVEIEKRAREINRKKKRA